MDDAQGVSSAEEMSDNEGKRIDIGSRAAELQAPRTLSQIFPSGSHLGTGDPPGTEDRVNPNSKIGVTRTPLSYLTIL